MKEQEEYIITPTFLQCRASDINRTRLKQTTKIPKRRLNYKF